MYNWYTQNSNFSYIIACTHCGFDDIYNIGDGINVTLGYCHPQSGHCMCNTGIQCQEGYSTSAACTSCDAGYDMYPYCMDDGSSTTPDLSSIKHYFFHYLCLKFFNVFFPS